MNGYNIVYFAVVLSLISSFIFTRKINNRLFVILSIILIALVGFRHYSMTFLFNDTYSYYQYFLNGDSGDTIYNAKEIEPALTFLNLFLRKFTSNLYLYGIIMATLSIGPIMFLYKKYAKLPIVAVFFYCTCTMGGLSIYMLEFAAMRQMLALGVWGIVAYIYINNKRKITKEVVIGVILMFLIHQSSLLVVILFLIDHVHLSKKIIYISVVVATISGLFIENYFPYLNILLNYAQKSAYLIQLADFNLRSIIFYPTMIISMTFFATIDECNTFEFKSLFLAVILLGLMSFFGNGVERMVTYYEIPGFIAISSFVYSKFKTNKMISLSFFFVLFLFFSYTFFRMTAHFAETSPYSMF